MKAERTAGGFGPMIGCQVALKGIEGHGIQSGRLRTSQGYNTKVSYDSVNMTDKRTPVGNLYLRAAKLRLQIQSG
jgi:hypothetical protein